MRNTLTSLFFLILIGTGSLFAQSVINTYGNEWIKYDQSYLKIGISQKGIHKIATSSLPATFKAVNPSDFQLWHRGKEIAILKASAEEILFYAEPNDGASDSLLFRPASARINKYVSFFSDKSAYFLTVKSGGKRAVTADTAPLAGNITRYHDQKDIFKFSKQFGFSTYGAEKSLNNSFYVAGNTWTGTTIAGINASRTAAVKDSAFVEAIQLNNWAGIQTGKPEVEVMVNGMQEGAHEIVISLGNSTAEQDMSKITTFPLSNWDAKKVALEVSAEKLSNTGRFYLKVQSQAKNTLDWFAVSFYTVAYAQLTDLGTGVNAKKVAYYNYKPTTDRYTRIAVANAGANSELLDITDPDMPRKINASITSNGLEAMVSRTAGKSLNLLVYDPATEIITVPASAWNSVNFTPFYASATVKQGEAVPSADYDYLIVSTGKLQDAATEYAKYRSSAAGGSYRTLAVDIKAVYDQFNYGEPSPVAIRRFADYMLKDGIRSKHNLLLIGPSVTYPLSMVKELPDEVPTFGDPGSDILLVAGLKGSHPDVPAIPVGRITASSPTEVRSYLDKVRVYEADTDFSWRKDILHLNGGHNTPEINQLKSILEDLSPLIEEGHIGGKVHPFVKRTPTPEVETVNITPEVNSGVGMITYFGHGSISVTDLNMGFVSDVNKGYEANTRYPIMYFNGCGVGNVFFRFAPSSMSADWLLTPQKGSIGVIANSYLSYVSSSSKHLGEIYSSLFSSDTDLTLGQVLESVAQKIAVSNPNTYDIANIHQTNLQGDPGLKIAKPRLPDYALEADENIILFSETGNTSIQNSKTIRAGVVVTNKGKFLSDQKVPVQAIFFFKDGTQTTQSEVFSSIAYRDTLYFSINNVKPLNKVDITVDPGNSISELSKANNTSELLVDWDVAKALTVYPNETVKDVIAPVLRVTFDDRTIENEEAILPKPTIAFVLTDDRFLKGKTDSSLVDIFIRPCGDGNCAFKKLSYSANLEVVYLANNKLQITYKPQDLEAGTTYEMLVNARDASGNMATQPYNIWFKVSSQERILAKVVASPNPASSYVKFSSVLDDPQALQSIHLFIYNASGHLLNSKELRIAPSRINEWYWFPQGSSRMYIYKMMFVRKNGEKEEVGGKLVIVK
jgi:hypothetical protein